jgi:hypothetical protein
MNLAAENIIEAENPGPDPREALAIDSFFLAVEGGDEKETAEALRKIGKLSGCPLSFFARILDPGAAHSKIPCRIGFAKPTKGRPRKPKSKLSPFLYFLSIKAAGKAAIALRSRRKVSGSELKVLADLFDKNVELPNGFSFRLRLVKNRKGRPVNKFEKGVSDFYWRRIFEAALAKTPKAIKPSIRATVREVIDILEEKNKSNFLRGKKPKPLPSYSTIRNDLKRLGFLKTKKKKYIEI